VSRALTFRSFRANGNNKGDGADCGNDTRLNDGNYRNPNRPFSSRRGSSRVACPIEGGLTRINAFIMIHEDSIARNRINNQGNTGQRARVDVFQAAS